MLKWISIIAVAFIGGILIYAATKPDDFRVERSVMISAPPERIFPLVNELRQFGAWSPYEKKDPAMKRAFSGPPAGKGAIYEWDGDSEVGKGRMEITDAAPPSKIVIDLKFEEPFKANNTVEFTLEPQGDATRVTWAMHGPSPYIAKLMGMAFDMDAMIGGDFEAGLTNLKAAAER